MNNTEWTIKQINKERKIAERNRNLQRSMDGFKDKIIQPSKEIIKTTGNITYNIIKTTGNITYNIAITPYVITSTIFKILKPSRLRYEYVFSFNELPETLEEKIYKVLEHTELLREKGMKVKLDTKSLFNDDNRIVIWTNKDFK